MKLPVIATVMALGIATAGMVYADRSAPEHDHSAQGTDIERTDVPGEGGSYPTTTTGMGSEDVEPIDTEDFLETAMAKGIAEVETSRLAVEKGGPRVKEFANRMIEDHGNANRKLAEIATQENIETPDDATLMDRAKSMVLQVRDGDSFDEAYINNQIEAHEQSIELFRRAAVSDSEAVKNFAVATLPKLEEHLEMAVSLKDEVSTADNR
ncbi:MAG TPA: DUF4142 domain-containing protein [Porticoccaceae bacterium]